MHSLSVTVVNWILFSDFSPGSTPQKGCSGPDTHKEIQSRWESTCPSVVVWHSIVMPTVCRLCCVGPRECGWV